MTTQRRAIGWVRSAGAGAGAGLLTVRRLRLWVLMVVSVAAIGTLGYIVLERWSVVGRPVHDGDHADDGRLQGGPRRSTRPGRVWTMLLSIAGVGIIFGTVGIVAEAFLSGGGQRATGGDGGWPRRSRSCATTSSCAATAGSARRSPASSSHGGQAVVVVDIRPESLERRRGATATRGGRRWHVRRRSSPRRASVGRAGSSPTIDSDANNVYVTLSARALNPGLFIVGRANAPGAEAKVLQAGANRVVSPYTMAGQRIAELALRPRVADFIDAALSQGELAFSMEEVEVGAGGPLDRRTVGELRADGIFTLAIVRGPGDYEANPPDERVLAVGETLIVSGSAEILRQLRERA